MPKYLIKFIESEPEDVRWEFMWGAPQLDIKITKVMCALRLQDDVIENDEIKASF